VFDQIEHGRDGCDSDIHQSQDRRNIKDHLQDDGSSAPLGIHDAVQMCRSSHSQLRFGCFKFRYAFVRIRCFMPENAQLMMQCHLKDDEFASFVGSIHQDMLDNSMKIGINRRLNSFLQSRFWSSAQFEESSQILQDYSQRLDRRHSSLFSKCHARFLAIIRRIQHKCGLLGVRLDEASHPGPFIPDLTISAEALARLARDLDPDR
jgi:hypothetical protein